ncbi:MAG: geranylgeranyl pyrophosphate synthase, partial [Pseudonocardia sp.]|nr:geranylgeranyl pyrophosphate synthase [Pseudonocardia sp.]
AEDGLAAERLRELLAGPVTDDALVAEALGLLRASGGLAAARETLRQYSEQARGQLAVLPDRPAREALATLARYVVERTG